MFIRLAQIVSLVGIGLISAVAMMAQTRPAFSPLPSPAKTGKMSLEEALNSRRSVRRFEANELTAEQIAQLCWAAQGISDPERGRRTAPSAGATYPLELYVVTAGGVDRYIPASHALERHLSKDVRDALTKAAMNQKSVAKAGAVFVIAADVSRTAGKYSRRADSFVLLEVGHAGQNLLLQAVSLGLGAVPIGAYNDEQAAQAISLPPTQKVMYLIPVGVPAK